MFVHILEPGLLTLVVDRGRPGTRSLGVPLGGAADRSSLVLGNALVGNPPDAAALEINLVGPRLQAECELGCVLFGAPFEMHSDRQQLEPGTTFTLGAGEELHIGATAQGMRGYFCIRGGFQTMPLLGSRSSLAPLEAGAELACLSGKIGHRFIRSGPLLGQGSKIIRVVSGPQKSWFPGDLFLSQTYRITPASNRMGLRLAGGPLPFPTRELVSEPVAPGAVQVTSNGQCIILGVDGQTIGGYPKIAQVISADLDALAQLRPEECIRFVEVSLEEAARIYHERQRELHEWVTRLMVSSL
jgi:antagonist of KipI